MRRCIFHFPFSIFHSSDRDGVYTAGVDARREWTFSRPGNTSLMIGDADNDSIPDGVELADGADWNASTNYCFNLSVTYTDIFQTTNALTFAALWGTNTVWGPTPVPDRTWSFDFGHRVAAHGERASVQVWDDIDGNGRWDGNEAGDRYEFRPSAHTTAVTNALPYGSFDRDRDNLPDWWEGENGLSMNGVPSDEYADPDEDGLINLHEFLAGTNPMVPDGEDTLVYSLIHSVDDRLVGKNAQQNWLLIENYSQQMRSGTGIVRNPNCWLSDVALPSVAEMEKPGLNGPWQGGMYPVVIGSQHVIYAKHCGLVDNTVYQFVRPNGDRILRTLIAHTNVCPNETDIQIGLLDNPLPDDIPPARFIPHDYAKYIGNGYGIPVVRIDKEQRAVVQELKEIPNSRSGCLRFQASESANRRRFWSPAVWGDSGRLNFMIVGNQAVYLYPTHVSTSDTHDGSSCLPIRYKAEIENAANAMSARHGVSNNLIVQEFDFSGGTQNGE